MLPPPDEVGQRHPGIVDLTALRLAPQLQHRLVDHGQPGRAAGVAAGEQPPVGVERDAPARPGVALGDELLSFALGAEAEELVVLELLVHEGVVAVGHADVLGTEPGGLVALLGRRPVMADGPTTGPTKVCPGV